MAPPTKKKEAKDLSGLSFEEVDKLIRSVNKNEFTLIGDKEISEFCTVPKIRTNLPVFDYLLGGGLTKGRLTCIAGEESAGKCLGKNTPVMMFDGSIKMSQDISVGDKLMGDDGTYRNVSSVTSGREELFKVKQSYGDDYIVNASHILSVRDCRSSKDQNIKDINVKDFINKDISFRRHHKGFKVGVEYPNREYLITLDPYFVGLWLGDGDKYAARIFSDKRDIPVIEYLESFAIKYSLKVKIHKELRCENGIYIYLTKGSSGGLYRNPIVTELKNLDLYGNKHVPDVYLYNTRNVRLKLLAGLIDSDGSYDSRNNTYEFSNKNENIIDDVVILCRSLGYRATKNNKYVNGEEYFRIYINSEDFSEIPCKLFRKKGTFKTIRTNPTYSALEFESLGIGDYYGFTIDGNHRFLLGDFTVTHNTTTAIEIIAELINDLKRRGSFKRILWNDVEGAWDSKRAKNLGVDQDYIIIKRIKVLEEFFEYADEMMSLGVIDAIVVDSLDNQVPRKIEENAYSATMGSMAGALGQHLPKFFSKMIETNTTVIFIKQAREKVGGFNPSPQPVLIINGGRTLRHDLDTTLILQRLSNKDKDYTPIKIKAQKTRSARLGMTYQFSLGANGTDKVRDIVTLAIEHGIVVVGGGGWTSYGDIRVHGADNFISEIRSNKEALDKLWTQVYKDVIDIDECLIAGDEDGILLEDTD